MKKRLMRFISVLLVLSMTVTVFPADTVFAEVNSSEEVSAEYSQDTEKASTEDTQEAVAEDTQEAVAEDTQETAAEDTQEAVAEDTQGTQDSQDTQENTTEEETYAEENEIETIDASDNLEEYLSENNGGDELYRLVVEVDDDISDIDDVLDDISGVTDYIFTEDECVIEFETEDDIEAAKDDLDSSDTDMDYWEDEVITDALCDYSSWESELTGLSFAKSGYEAAYDSDDKVVVAVIDSGIDDDDSVFSGRISSDSITYDGDELADTVGHGTKVAGILAEYTPSNVELLIIDAFDEDGNSSLYTIKSAITYAMESGADIINMSWGFTSTDSVASALDSLISEAEAEGIIMVASAGNNGADVTDIYPANKSEVISVSSIDDELELSSFSNYGSLIDFCAPGENVDTVYGTSSGTSFAAPFVSAAAAYMVLLDMSVYDSLKEYAVDIDDDGWDEKTGYGYIDLSSLFTSDDDPGEGRLSGEYTDSASLSTGPTSYSKCTHASKFSNTTIRKGIDVSKWQGTIDWDKVADSGVEFAIIRVGYRGYGSGTLNLDSKAEENIKGALDAGIKVGLYFFTQATTTSEAKAEANYVIKFLNSIDVDTDDITLPIAMDFEYASGNTGRLYEANLTKAQATNICLAFCEAIEASGYSAMVYASKSVFENDMNASTISASYDIWLAHYTTSTSYSGDYTYWQFSSSGSISGISGNVDMNFWYDSGSDSSSETPSITSATTNGSGTTIKWNTVSDVSGYVIWRKEYGGSWSRIATVSSSKSSYTDKEELTSGTTYYYKIRGYFGDLSTANKNTFDSEYWTDCDSTAKKIVYLSAPALKSTQAASGGVKVSWNKVSGASGYVVYRKTSSGSWQLLGKTTSNSYTDKTAKTGTTYYYTARAYTGKYSTAKSNKYNALYWGKYDNTGVKGKYIKTPTLKSATATASGTKITWSAVTNASGYAVYRKKSGGSWERIGTTTSTSYTDKEILTSGATYYYRVRTYKGTLEEANANTNCSYYWSYTNVSGLKSVYLATPELNSMTTAADKGIKVSWSKVSGASGYVVYRKTSSGSWKLLGNTTSNSYTDKTAKTGTTYYYTVRAYKGKYATAKKNKYNAAYWGGYDNTGIKGRYIKKTTISSAQATSNGIKLTWNEVSGISGYVIWRKEDGGSWKRIAELESTETSYTDKEALTSGKTYYYRIRTYKSALSNANKNTFSSFYWSYYDTNSTKIVYLSKPTLLSAKQYSTGNVKITWNKVSGATGYVIYRKTKGGSWTMIGTSSTTDYMDKTVKSDKTYYYTVRAYKGKYSNAKKNKYSALYWSGYDSNGITY